jgi:hypothetical protein
MNFLVYSTKIFQILGKSPKFKILEEGQAVLVTETSVPGPWWWSHNTDFSAVRKTLKQHKHKTTLTGQAQADIECQNIIHAEVNNTDDIMQCTLETKRISFVKTLKFD